MSAVVALDGLDPARYHRHPTHTEAATWGEKNCYADLWIELLHAMGHEPLAMLPFTLSLDFLGDQWTFYKPSHDALRDLYDLEVQELTVWRPLLDHALEHLAAGRLLCTESDAFWLPDTAGTDYRTKHTKTTIAINSIDLAARRLTYFHNAGFYAAEGEDFDHLFGLHAPAPADFLPLFAELVIPHNRVRRTPRELRALSMGLVRRHLALIPDSNPVQRFHDRLLADLPLLHDKGLDHYHAWAFATTRQLGSAFELASCHLRWLADGAANADGLLAAAQAFDRISTRSKTFILKGARMVAGRRPMTEGEAFDDMALAWTEGMTALKGACA